MSKSIRERLNDATAGRPLEQPVYAVYDWFVNNRPHVDWQGLFELGLGQINHANVIRHEHPNFELIEETREENGGVRRDVRLVTDLGELHEWYAGEWRQEHFIKTPEDYRIMARALEGVRVFADNTAFEASNGVRCSCRRARRCHQRGRPLSPPLRSLQRRPQAPYAKSKFRKQQ